MVHVDVKEQREYPRMVLSLPVLVEVQGKAGGVMYRIFNLSEGGVFIPTDSPLPVPSEVTLFFILDSGTLRGECLRLGRPERPRLGRERRTGGYGDRIH